MALVTTWLDQFFKFPGGTVSLAEGNINRTEAIENIANVMNVIYTGALTANKTVTYPLPADNASSYMRTIWNNTTGGYDLILTVGVGTTVSILAGSTAFLIFEPAGVRLAHNP